MCNPKSLTLIVTKAKVEEKDKGENCRVALPDGRGDYPVHIPSNPRLIIRSNLFAHVAAQPHRAAGDFVSS